MIIIYYKGLPLEVYPLIAYQFGYKTGRTLTSQQQFLELTKANAHYCQLLCLGKGRFN